MKSVRYGKIDVIAHKQLSYFLYFYLPLALENVWLGNCYFFSIPFDVDVRKLMYVYVFTFDGGIRYFTYI